MPLTWKTVIAVLLLQVVILQTSANSNTDTPGRYLKREERGTPSKLRFTSGSYGFYNASITEANVAHFNIKCDMKIGIYIYDRRTEIVFKVDDTKRFSVRSQKIEDFVFLHLAPTRVLNSDIQSVYTLNVIALNNRSREEIDRTRIYLHVLDVNEFKPRFLNKSIDISLKENVEIGKELLRVHADDADSGVNGALYYFIAPSDVLSVGEFSLHPHTGVLSLVKPLDFTRRKSYTFHILAKDKCPNENQRLQSEPLSVRITVLFVPKLPASGRMRGKRQDFPDLTKFASLSFSQSVYTFSIAEISPPFTPLVRVELNKSYRQKIPNVNFGFSKGNEEGRFKINIKTGQIYLAGELDYEKTTSYSLTVVAYHKSLIKGRTYVIIRVLDSNDHSPTFPKLEDQIDVDEGVPVGKEVYRANASDLDTGVNKQIVYSIGNMNETYFDIDPTTGLVRVAKRIDRDGEKSVSPSIMFLVIKASDFGVPVKREGRMLLKVRINRAHESPPVLQYAQCRITLARNAEKGSPVMKVNAKGLYPSSQITFSITGGVLKIAKHTGHVTLNDIPEILKESHSLITPAHGRSIGKSLNVTIVMVPGVNGKKINVTCLKNPEYAHTRSIIKSRMDREKALSTEMLTQVQVPLRKSHKPIILEKPDTVIRLREDLQVGSFVTRVVAVDTERKCYGLVLYSIISGSNNVDSNFAIDMLNGSIYLAGKIDREQNPSYNLKIRAWDTDSPPQFTDVAVQVEIVDVNDNGPAFSKKKYEVTIPENTQPGTIILQVHARDPDRGRNGVVLYSLVNDFQKLFSLNKYTGQLKLGKMLDYEKTKEYNLMVQAVDSSSQVQQISLSNVVIKVSDLNDTPPKCMPVNQTFEVTKDFPPGAVLGKILAYDPDTGDGGRLHFEFGRAKAQRLFSLDNEYGILRTNVKTMATLVTESVYNVTIIVSDRGIPSLSTTCNIVCILKPSLSSERPKFSRQGDKNLIIADIIPGNIVMVDATLESSGEMEYSLVDGTGIGDFTVDPKSGVISRSDTGSSKDHKSASHYWLTVNAHLKKHPKVYSNIALLLKEKNNKIEAPYFDPTAYRASVKENLPSLTEVLQLSVVNQNSGSDTALLAFRIIDGNDLGHFEVTEHGKIRTRQSLDREKVAAYHLNVSVSNPHLPKLVTFASVVISVKDVNDNDPQIIPPTSYWSSYVLEQDAITTGNGRYLGQILATDKDEGENAELVYQMESGDKRIDLNPKTGMLSSKAALRNDDYIAISAKICDKGGRCIHQWCDLVVVGKPKHHLRMLRFRKKEFTIKLKESTSPFSHKSIAVLSELVISSKNPSELIKFSIESGNEDGKFGLNPFNEGELLQVSELDYESKKEYKLVVKGTNGQSSDTATLKIVLIDLNDNLPTTSQSCYEAEVMENSDSGKVIFQVEALDADSISKGKTVYKLVGINPPIVGNRSFTVSPDGKIRTERKFNRELQSRYVLTLHAEDHTSLSGKIRRTTFCVIVHIKDANDHKPRFTKPLYVTRVSSPLPADTPLLRLLAVDYDIGTNALLRFSITDGNDGGHFKIDSATGIISSGKRFLSREQKTFQLDVEVADSGTTHIFKDRSVVKITVYPAKPRPGFANRTYNIRIPENQREQPVLDVSIPNVRLHYRILARNQSAIRNCADDFQIDHLTGTISTKMPFDAEKFTVCTFSVHATDNIAFKDYTNVVVNIKDENDNAPKFLNASYSGSIDEGSKRGSEILSMDGAHQQPLVINAKDADSGENSRITYSIVETSAKRDFEIDSHTGKVITRQVLDREKKSKFQFHVLARDNGSPRLFAFTKVTITVNDINDKMPEFTQQIYRVQLYRPIFNDTEVVTVRANDEDSNVFSSIYYTLMNHNELFHISSTSGTIWTKNAALITNDDYSLTVTASDGIFTSSCQVIVSLSQIKTDKFKFREPVVQASVLENNPNSERLIILNAVGYGIGDRIEYSIINPSAAFFIDSNVGAIYTRNGVSFDREKRSHYLLIVQGKITRVPSQVAQGIVNVTIADANDNKPQFVGDPYYQSVHIDMPAKAKVLQVAARDADEGSNAEVRYKITGGSLGKFEIDERTGVITVKEKFIKGKTPSKFNLEITATDMGSPKLKSVTRVEIPVVNEDMPVFDKNYQFAVSEDATISTTVGKIIAKGPDGRHVYYSIRSGDEYDQFTLDFNTGELSTLDTLDLSEQDVYNLTVQATDSKSGSWSTTGCSIRVLDVNNHRPMFEKPLYTASVDENAVIGSLVSTVKAIDKDRGLNAQVTYSFGEADKEKLPFVIDQDKGTVRVIGALDYESEKTYRIRVHAFDKGTSPLSTSTFLRIDVVDVNDNPPVFDQEQYNFIVGDFIRPGQFVGKVSCFDKDRGVKSRIRYSITDSTLASVNRYTGVLNLNREPKRGSDALFQIKCTDGKFTSSANVVLKPEHVNEHSPTFHSPNLDISVQDNHAPAFLTVITAADLDFGSYGTVSYSIDSSSLQEKFHVNPTTGDIFTKVALDRETEKDGKIVVPIRATDIGGKFGICKLSVNIVDVNDNDPVFEFSSYEATVSSATKIGTTILRVKAIDKDSGKNGDITYSISGLDNGAPLTINKETGVLELIGSVQGSAYQFVVKALDNGYPVREDSASVRINVVSSTQPVLMFGALSYNKRISESAPPGQRVYRVSLKSTEGSIKYEFVKGNLPSSDPTGMFTIDSTTGSIHLARKLDYETTPEYSLMIKASSSDANVKAVYTVVKVQVENVNDNYPVFDSKVYNITVPENIAVNSEVLHVVAFDKDDPRGTQLRYSISEHTSAEDRSLFSLNEKTGALTIVNNLDAERKSSHELTLRVKDEERSGGRGHSDTAVVKITVLDVNDSPPKFVPGHRRFTVREDHVIGEKIASVLAQDADNNPIVRYYIEKGNQLGLFKIDENSGEIKLVAPLDRELVSRHAITVIAYDGVFVAKVDMEIIVTDINDNDPVCKNAFYNIAIAENTNGSPVVSQIIANDYDSNDELTYSLQGDGFNKFLVNERTGELMPHPGIDREKHSTCDFRVLVTDKGGRSCYSDVYVDILDKNDNKPVFLQTNYIVPVRENASVSSMITRVQATDKDKGSNRKISYRLVGSEFFTVQPRTGIIILEKPLNKKVKSSHSLTVEAYDDGNPALSSSVSVRIVVLGASERPPEFTKPLFTFSVREDLAVNGVVGVVETVKKSGSTQGPIEYELLAGDRTTFQVERHTGKILLRKKLDHEEVQSMSLNIRAVYTRVASLSSVVPVTVHIQDVNDNHPVFLQKVYSATVDENVRAGLYVAQVFAGDKDTGLNGRVAYRLIKSGEAVPFKVDKQTGIIKVADSEPIDREQRSHYLFKIRAFDAGTPSLFSDAIVNVTIADLNDNPPEIDKPNSTVIVQNPKKGDMLFSWVSKDRDSSKNGPPFTYTIIKGDKSKFSVLDESDVKGSLIADANLGEGSRYDLVVRVTDNGSPPQSSLCYLTVFAVKEGRAKPVITEPTMLFTVIRKPFELVRVGSVRIIDKDQFGLHDFKIISGNDDNTFSIETISGLITGRPKQGIYTLGVEVSDGKYVSRAVITIVVNLITDDLYQNSVVITALGISADDFLQGKMKGFANHIRRIFSAKIENIIIWAIQTKDAKRKTRAVSSRSDTEVAFAVRRSNERGYIAPSTLQSSLKASKESLERELSLSVLITVTDPCASTPCPIDMKCAAVVKPVSSKNPSSTDNLYTMFTRNYACFCLDGSKGPDCTGITACSSNPCRQNEKCTPIGSSYECEKDMNGGAIQLDGKDYVSYLLRESFDSVFKSLEVSFRTEASDGYLFYAKESDYCILEIHEGKIRFRFDFGSGQGIVEIDDVQVNDGKWHNVKVIRDANHAKMSLDGDKFKSEGRAKGQNMKINLNSDTVYFGAGVIVKGSIEHGFRGCLRHAKLNGQLLPWNGNSSLILNGRSYGVKRSCKDSGACEKTKCPLFSDCINTLSSYRCQCMPGHTGTFCKATVTCADNPCRNGGTCTYFKANGIIEYRCKCRAPYTGAQCQTDSGLCASNPCRNGGKCENINDGTDYQCKCPPRYHGPNCELDSDPCASSPCFFGAKCTRVQYSFKCDCPPGKKGKRCGYGYYCENHRCGAAGKCIETLDGPVCKCRKGYEGAYCQFDVNECLHKSTMCPLHANCINTVGSYFCNCTNENKCSQNGYRKKGQDSFNMINIVYWVALPVLFVIIIVIAVVCYRRRRSRRKYGHARDTLDYKYPQVDCVPLGSFAPPPQVPPRFDDVPPDYYTDGSADFATTALYDPSQDAFSPQSTVSGDSCRKAPQSSIELPRKLQLHTFKASPSLGSHRGGAEADGKGSVSDVSDSGDHLHGPYHWDYSEVPEDVVNRSKANRSGSKEGSRMGLSYNYGYDETPRIHEKLPEKLYERRSSVAANPEEGENPNIPKRPVNFRLSWQSLAKTEMESPKTARGKVRAEPEAVKPERLPAFQRATASRGSENSLLEPYNGKNTQLSVNDFNNRYSLAQDDDTSLYLQDYLGGECPAPPSETCPSDIDTCTRPSLSMAFSDTDDVPYMQQRRMLPSEISGLDGMTETSYNSDDDEDINEKDPLDPDETKKLEREIKILIRDISSKTEAEY